MIDSIKNKCPRETSFIQFTFMSGSIEMNSVLETVTRRRIHPFQVCPFPCCLFLACQVYASCELCVLREWGTSAWCPCKPVSSCISKNRWVYNRQSSRSTQQKRVASKLTQKGQSDREALIVRIFLILKSITTVD